MERRVLSNLPVVHMCALDRECRSVMRGELGPPPWRLSIDIPGWRYLAIALRKRDKFTGQLDIEMFKKTGRPAFVEASRWTRVVPSPRRNDR